MSMETKEEKDPSSQLAGDPEANEEKDLDPESHPESETRTPDPQQAE